MSSGYPLVDWAIGSSPSLLHSFMLSSRVGSCLSTKGKRWWICSASLFPRNRGCFPGTSRLLTSLTASVRGLRIFTVTCWRIIWSTLSKSCHYLHIYTSTWFTTTMITTSSSSATRTKKQSRRSLSWSSSQITTSFRLSSWCQLSSKSWSISFPGKKLFSTIWVGTSSTPQITCGDR